MILDAQVIKITDGLFIVEKLPSGKMKYTPGEVVDLNEHMKCVKLFYSANKTRMVRKWHPAANLLRTVPVEEKTP